MNDGWTGDSIVDLILRTFEGEQSGGVARHTISGYIYMFFSGYGSVAPDTFDGPSTATLSSVINEFPTVENHVNRKSPPNKSYRTTPIDDDDDDDGDDMSLSLLGYENDI